jgi:3-(3-hydroxy-phenyl)propionate hydroxylase
MTLALVRKGIPVLLVEAEPEPLEDQRAANIHAPTLEMLAALGLKDQAFAEDTSGGFPAPVFQFRDRASGELIASFDIRLLEGEVAYPFVLQWEQYKLVRAALPLLLESGLAEIRFATKLTGLIQHAELVEVTVETDGATEHLSCAYVIGADGGRSMVRRLADIDFAGFTWEDRFIKIATSFDFVATGKDYCTRNYFSDPDEWLNLFKVKGNGPPGYWRGIMPVPAGEADEQAQSMESIQSGCAAFTTKAAISTSRITRSIPCISALPRLSTKAACCSPAMPPMSTIQLAEWA